MVFSSGFSSTSIWTSASSPCPAIPRHSAGIVSCWSSFCQNNKSIRAGIHTLLEHHEDIAYFVLGFGQGCSIDFDGFQVNQGGVSVQYQGMRSSFGESSVRIPFYFECIQNTSHRRVQIHFEVHLRRSISNTGLLWTFFFFLQNLRRGPSTLEAYNLVDQWTLLLTRKENGKTDNLGMGLIHLNDRAMHDYTCAKSSEFRTKEFDFLWGHAKGILEHFVSQ